MGGKSGLMLRVMMNRYHQGAPDAFLERLNPEEAKIIAAMPISAQQPSEVLVATLELLKQRVHYSWLEPIVMEFSPAMRGLLISILPEEQASSLSKRVAVPLLPPPSDPVKRFFSNVLYDKLNAQAIVPPGFLKETPFSILLNLEKVQLITLIDYLGIYDLAFELREIVDKEVIKDVYAALSARKLNFLKVCLHQKERVQVAKMGLKNWRGDAAKLLRILHRRGIQRLACALSGQQPDLLWYLSRRLDSGRGRLLLAGYSKSEIRTATAVMAQQVLNTINFIRKMGEM